jgi:acyl carrier protein
MSSTPLEDRVRGIVATIFDVPLDEVTADTSRETLERWDSMGHLVLTLELEQEFGVNLDPEQVIRMTSVREAAAILASEHAVPV